MVGSSRRVTAADRAVGPLDELRDEQRPAHEQRAGLLDRGPALVPLVVAPRRLDQLRARQARPRAPRTWRGCATCPTRRCGTRGSARARRATSASSSPGTSASSHGQYATAQRSITVEELLRGPSARKRSRLRGLRRQHLLPLVERDDGLHAAVPRGVGRRHAVVVRELEQPGHAAADPPHREAGGDVGVAGRGEQRHACAARAAGDHRRAEVEVAQQRAERVGLHLRLRPAAEHDRRRPAVRAVPREHLPARGRPAPAPSRGGRRPPW